MESIHDNDIEAIKRLVSLDPSKAKRLLYKFLSVEGCRNKVLNGRESFINDTIRNLISEFINETNYITYVKRAINAEYYTLAEYILENYLEVNPDIYQHLFERNQKLKNYATRRTLTRRKKIQWWKQPGANLELAFNSHKNGLPRFV